MKNINPLYIILVLMTVMALLFINSCKKGGKHENSVNDTLKAPEIQAAKDYAEADMYSDDIVNIANAAIIMDNDAFTGKYCCSIERKQIALTNNTFYNKVTIDFGTANKSCANQRLHRGKIIASYSGDYFLEGFTDTITLDHFYLNNSLIEGRHIVSNTPEITKKSMYSKKNLKSGKGTNLSWRVDAQNIKITHPNNLFHYWNSARLRQQNENSILLDWDSYSYTIYGQAQGTDINSVNYIANIVKPLNKANNCLWVDTGTIFFSIEGDAGFSLYYGNGPCDKIAYIKSEKNDTINLP